MATLNKNAATLSKEFASHGATDITGFGIRGHAQNLVEAQEADIDFHIHTLPIFKHTDVICKEIADFGLLRGTSAETSGGLLLILPQDKVDGFQRELKQKYDQSSWIIGEVVPGSKKVIFGSE